MRYRVSIIETRTYGIVLSAKDEDAASEKALALFEKAKEKVPTPPDYEKFEMIDEDYSVEDVEEEG